MTDTTSITIAHVLSGLQVGGLERVVVNLVRALSKMGYRQHVICLEDGGPFAEQVEACGVSVTVLGKRLGMNLCVVRQLAALFRKKKVSIVHTHNPSPHFHGILAAVLAGVPVRIHTKHGRNYPENAKRVLLGRVLSWFTDVIVPVSDDAAEVLLKVEKVNSAKIRRIWNGVDTELYKPVESIRSCEVAEESGFVSCDRRAGVVGTIARLSPEKDQATMLASFALVLKALPRVRLIIVGDGSCRRVLEEQAHSLGISGQVEFLGMRSDIPDLMRAFDIFTLSSTTEGTSMTILEAMACGVPVVATEVGGNSELIDPPHCGLVSPAGNVAALASAYLALLKDPVRRNKMGIEGRKRVMENFSLPFMANQYATLYEQSYKRKYVD